MWLALCQHSCHRHAFCAHRPRLRAVSKVACLLHSEEASEPSLPVGSLITSVNNAYVKHCVKLRQRSKYRNGMRRVLVCGSVLLNELAAQTSLNVRVLFIPTGSTSSQLQFQADKIIEVNEAVLKKLSGLETASGLDSVAEVELPSTAWTVAGKGSRLRRVLALDGVQDPGNMGTLLRTARAMGWDAAWLLPGCCDPFNDKALRASRGAALTLPLSHGSWEELVQVAAEHGLQLLAAEPEVQEDVTGALSDSSGAQCKMCFNGVVLVLGSEGRGLSSDALHHCRAVSIPMPGAMESLNVSTAGAILMFMMSEGMPLLQQKLDCLLCTTNRE